LLFSATNPGLADEGAGRIAIAEDRLVESIGGTSLLLARE